MSYQSNSNPDQVLDMLGDPTRRHILDLLRRRARPVNELAGELPVSRPAVSKHLRLLKQAGLVVDQAEGTRRIYRIRPEGFRSVVAYWDEYWSQATTAFKQHVEGGDVMKETQLLVRKELLIERAMEDVFRIFTEEIVAWWPLEGHEVLEGEKDAVMLEPYPGGRLYERTVDGREADWGRVVEYEAPSRLVLRWHPGYGEELATTITIQLEAIEEDRTRFVLVHSGWEVHGAEADARAAGYGTGWDVVLGGFVELANQ